MKRIIFAGYLFITFAFFCVFNEPSHSSFAAQQESIFGQYKDDSTHTTSNSNGDQWAKTYGGVDDDTGSQVFEKSDGSGYILAGGNFSYDPNGDIWILDLSLSGDIVWQRTYGGAADCDLLYGGIEETGDGGYVVVAYTGSFGTGNNDSWILKLTSSGDIEWQRTYGGSDSHNYPYSFQITSDGGYIVAGGTYSISAEDRDAWVLKLTSSGDIEWQNTYGGGSDDRATSIQQTEDGGYIVAGWTDSFGAGLGDLWILKLTSSGDIEWQRTYGGSSYEYWGGIQETSVGGYIVSVATGSFGDGDEDLWILKLTSSGDIEWQRAYGGSLDDGGGIQETSDGGYIVAGWTDSFGAGHYDGWILKLTSSGDIEWQRTYGGSEWDSADSIQETSGGGYIVAGSTKSFGAFRTEFDLWVLKLSPDGEISSCAITGSSDASVSDTSISPSDTNVTPVSKNFITYNTNILPGESDAAVHNLCPGPHTLTLSATAGGTTDPEPGTHTYDGGTEVIIIATPSSAYTFSGWSGDVSSYYRQITIAMDSDKSITANFIQTSTGDGDEGDDVDPGRRGVCFIATAAYGSALHPSVSNLRNFRDRYLMQKKLGRKTVDLYYKYSPFLADIIAKNKALKILVRISLFPLVAFSYSMVHFGPIITAAMLAFIFVVPIFLISFYRRKTGQAKDGVINMRPMNKIYEKRA